MIHLITQYYKINILDDEYQRARQNEVDYCLQKNFDNKYINKIHLLLEEDYNLDFINNKNNISIIKIITGKRLNFKDVFTYYNENIVNEICILINSDIFLDSSIGIIKNIDFDNSKLFIALNRYEFNDDIKPAFLNGLEIDECNAKKCQVFLEPYQPSIWSQDTWIWKNPIKIIDEFNFNLGSRGCDNHLNYLMYNLDYKILNCSHIICVNHYDRLSIIKTQYGVSKGNVSLKKEKVVGNMKSFLFLKNHDDIVDKYTKNVKNLLTDNKYANISYCNFEKDISEIELNDRQIIASSFYDELYKPSNVLFNNDNYWKPDDNDNDIYIQFNFNDIHKIVVIDIMGKPVSIDDVEYGYVSKFKLSYSINDIWIDEKIYDGIEINNANYIKKIYLDNSIRCNKLRINPIEYVNINALKARLFKIDDNNFIENTVKFMYGKYYNEIINNKLIYINKDEIKKNINMIWNKDKYYCYLQDIFNNEHNNNVYNKNIRDLNTINNHEYICILIKKYWKKDFHIGIERSECYNKYI
jgi:hypothetical protein